MNEYVNLYSAQLEKTSRALVCHIPVSCKFVTPGKFFPPQYSHNVTNPNSHLNPNPNLTLTHTAACGNYFPV